MADQSQIGFGGNQSIQSGHSLTYRCRYYLYMGALLKNNLHGIVIMAGLTDKMTGWTDDMAALSSAAITADNALGFVMVFQGITAYHTVFGLPLRSCNIIRRFRGRCRCISEDFPPKA